MVPSLLAPAETQRDASAKRSTCPQCGEKVQQMPPQRSLEQRPLCADCSLDNLPFTD
jgi:hypothetical protein